MYGNRRQIITWKIIKVTSNSESKLEYGKLYSENYSTLNKYGLDLIHK